jgi:hypothetical protein
MRMGSVGWRSCQQTLYVTEVAAASLISFIGITSMLGRVGLGTLGDPLRRRNSDPHVLGAEAEAY